MSGAAEEGSDRDRSEEASSGPPEDRILTLTVNPAVDKSSRVEHVTADQKLRCEPPNRDPGGGGLNVARAVQRLGGDAEAVFTAGGPTGEILTGLLDAEDLTGRAVEIRDWTRENLAVEESSTGRQYRYGMPGPVLEQDEWEECLGAVLDASPPPEHVVASGSLPRGVPDDFYARLARGARDRGVKLTLDASGEALRRASDAGTYLLKPNLNELSTLTDGRPESEKEIEDAARELVESGRTRIVLVSLGAAGGLLVTPERREWIRSPIVPIRSRVGAGDSAVGAMVLALNRGLQAGRAARFGIAAGAAAVTTPGSALCPRSETEYLFERMS